MLFGTRPQFRKQGLEILLFHAAIMHSRTAGYGDTEMGWILEDNHLMLKTLVGMGGSPYKTYRIYGLPNENVATA